MALSVATAFLFGLLPAIRASRIDLQASLHGEGRKTAHAPTSFARRLLVAADVAMAVVLLDRRRADDQERRQPARREPGLRRRPRADDADLDGGDGVREGRGRRREDRPDGGQAEGAAGRRVRRRRGADSARRQRRHVGLPHRRPPLRAAGSERRTLFGDAGILLGDAHPAAPRAPVHGRRSRRRRERDADRRTDGAHAVAERRSHRTACEDRRDDRPLAHDRRHRRRRAASGARRAADDADVHAAGAADRFVSDDGDPVGRRSVGAGGRGTPGDLVGRGRRAGVRGRAARGPGPASPWGRGAS